MFLDNVAFRFIRFSMTGIILSGLSIVFSNAQAIEVPVYDFSIAAYSQDVHTYLPQNVADYSRLLLSPEYQKKQLKQFYQHYYATDRHGLSPWSDALVTAVLPKVKATELNLIDDFDNQKQDSTHYHFAENFKQHDATWLNKISSNMQLNTLDATFQIENRAIVVHNTFARALPDLAPDFFHVSLPGQGFPFDNLQESALWVGTPLYVLHVSQDKAWSLVLTPDAYYAWIKSDDLAYVSVDFVDQWQIKAQKNLIAITQTETSVRDSNNHFLFTSYIGAVFPLVGRDADSTQVLIPLRNKQHQAVLAQGVVKNKAARLMPLPVNKKNIARLMKQLQNRPYGWGGVFFFNDCSQELKSLFTPFGIWLPRNSAQQSRYAQMDLSAQPMTERLNTLMTSGHPLLTIIYVGGHVMLYVGNYPSNQQTLTPMTYQNIWGLSPPNKDKRYVIGQSLFLPLLTSYPEALEARSLANATYFKLIFLDNLNEQVPSPSNFANQLLHETDLMEKH